MAHRSNWHSYEECEHFLTFPSEIYIEKRVGYIDIYSVYLSKIKDCCSSVQFLLEFKNFRLIATSLINSADFSIRIRPIHYQLRWYKRNWRNRQAKWEKFSEKRILQSKRKNFEELLSPYRGNSACFSTFLILFSHRFNRDELH